MRALALLGLVCATAAFSPAAMAAGRCPNGYVGLTFDDGPTASTADLLGALKKHRLRATMFDVGERAEARPDDVRAQVEAGMWVESHSFTHRNLTQLGPTELAQEIGAAQSALSGITGGVPTLFRPPFLLTNRAVRAELERQGLVQVLADVDTRDSRGASGRQIVAAVRRVKPGAIVLMHDGPAATRRAIPKIAAVLR